jgi:hypothetical protein
VGLGSELGTGMGSGFGSILSTEAAAKSSATRLQWPAPSGF